MSDVTFRGGDVGFCKNNLELFGEVCADYLPTLMRWWKPAVYRPENEIHRLQDGRSNPLGLGLCELNFYLPCSRHSVFFYILTPIWQIWESVTVSGGEIGFNLASPDVTGIIGSVSFTDSTGCLGGVVDALAIKVPERTASCRPRNSGGVDWAPWFIASGGALAGHQPGPGGE